MICPRFRGRPETEAFREVDENPRILSLRLEYARSIPSEKKDFQPGKF